MRVVSAEGGEEGETIKRGKKMRSNVKSQPDIHTHNELFFLWPHDETKEVREHAGQFATRYHSCTTTTVPGAGTTNTNADTTIAASSSERRGG